MLDKLEMFIAVAKESHFGRAAASLGVTQPTLSTGIKQLEEQLGVQLIFRGSRYGGLTPEGQSALEWARRIVGDARQLRSEMRSRRHGLAGQVSIAVIPTALTWAASLSASFNQRHPNVRFTILSRNSREILSMLENLEVDCGISYLDNEPLGRVHTEKLYNENYMLVCAAGSPFAGQSEIAWQDLDGEKLALLTPDMQNRRIINQNFMQSGVAPQAWIESNSIIVLIANVESGKCLTVLPADIARFLTEGKKLDMIPMKANGSGHEVGLVVPHRDPYAPVIEALLAEAKRLALQYKVD